MFCHGSVILPTRWAGTEHDGDKGQRSAGQHWVEAVHLHICNLQPYHTPNR